MPYEETDEDANAYLAGLEAFTVVYHPDNLKWLDAMLAAAVFNAP